MTELVSFMVKSLVDNKEAVEVTLADDETINVRVAKEDLGKVIGKDGRIAKAIRTVLSASATKDGRRASLEILD